MWELDVSARELVVAISEGGEPTMERVSNDAAGHERLQARLRALRAPVMICLEASGTYNLDVALALARPAVGWQFSPSADWKRSIFGSGVVVGSSLDFMRSS